MDKKAKVRLSPYLDCVSEFAVCTRLIDALLLFSISSEVCAAGPLHDLGGRGRCCRAPGLGALCLTDELVAGSMTIMTIL